ncbi:mitochondrial antiviral-signaling protein [Neopelma chrysocephalum]|uniref:mitochondrial antiviral-signaling protein n=1 Tax=Neopelma chrysocephalum TaxID=114329 RepID=UPI000FCD2161|nr:mitochondrial antiviral-signaling protein [Neopelma chrysocephalum]XP_027561353.1 mitochondrial antiviral-signaling protein [Neopelma chrysocephalum]
MGLAEDKVYSHIMRNLRHFGTIHVGSLADSLTCLVDSDRDELHAREEMRGTQATVFKFYQLLRCRKDWVQDLIQALRHNNAGHLADEVQEVYDTWKLRPSTPAADSSLHNNARPSASSISAQTPSLRPNSAPRAPLAEQPRRDLPVGDHPPVLPSAATTTSTDQEARIPVQESLPKKLLEQESLRPTPPGSSVCAGASGEGQLSHPGDTMQGSVGTPGVASESVPSAVPPEQGRDWLSRRPVCVDNGCFGNANHLHRRAPGLALGRALPAREPSATHSPEQPRNEPEEHSDESTEFPPRPEGAARGVGQQSPNSLPKKQPVLSSGPPSSFVDVRSPLLIQEQFDAEEKRVRMLQEHGGDGDSSIGTTTLVAPPVPRGTSPSYDTSVKSVPEKKPPAGNRAGSTYSMPTEKVFPASAAPLLGPAVVGSSEGTAGRSASRVSSVTNIWAPSCSNTEENVELSKPGVLVSVAPGDTEVPGRCPGSQGPNNPNSAASNSLGLSSDPILVSRDSSEGAFSRGSLAPAARADPRGQEAAGASRDSRSTPSWDTHEVRVDHYPSVQLGAGNDGVGPLGSPPDFDSSSGCGAATSPSQAKVPSGDSNGPSLPYILPAVGIAVISAVAFLVYARLQK